MIARMRLPAIMAAALVAVTFLDACAARREQRRQQQLFMHQQMQQPSGSTCSAPAAGSCPVCTIQCKPGEPALCAPGEMTGNTCSVQPSCKCGPAAPT
jgi:hypothetical protein